MKTLKLFFCLTFLAVAFLQAKPTRESIRRTDLHFDLSLGDKGLFDRAEMTANNSQHLAAARLYEGLIKWFPNSEYLSKAYTQGAGQYFLIDDYSNAMYMLQLFANEMPDSSDMAKAVDLAYVIGHKICSEPIAARSYRRLAIDAFKYVGEHDPYGVKAAESLISGGYMEMESKRWDEAVDMLVKVEQNLPGTLWSARAELMMAECFLGMNKGADYNALETDHAIELIESYQRSYPQGTEIAHANKLLTEAFRRKAISHLSVARYYISQRKFRASRTYLTAILKSDDLKTGHKEAKELIRFLDEKTDS